MLLIQSYLVLAMIFPAPAGQISRLVFSRMS